MMDSVATIKKLTEKKNDSNGIIKLVIFLLGLAFVAYASIKWGLARRDIENDKAKIEVRKLKLEDARVEAAQSNLSAGALSAYNQVFARAGAAIKRKEAIIAVKEEKLRRLKTDLQAAKSWDALEAQ